MKSNKIYFAVTVILLLSCSRNSQIFNKKNVILKQTFPIQKITNKSKLLNVIIEANTYFSEEKITYHDIHFNGRLVKKSNDSITSVLFNSLLMKLDDKGNFDSTINLDKKNLIFGDTLHLITESKSKLNSNETFNNLIIGHIPKVFMPTKNIERTDLYNEGIYVSLVILKPNFSFTWEKDSLNKNGVYIYIEFDPTLPGNEKHKDKLPKIMSNLITVDDNGSYIVNERMFEGFPSEAILRVYIGRTNMFNIKKQKVFKTPFQLMTASYCIGIFYYKAN